jgi:alcohol dehydrogenase (cytochrome c)
MTADDATAKLVALVAAFGVAMLGLLFASVARAQAPTAQAAGAAGVAAAAPGAPRVFVRQPPSFTAEQAARGKAAFAGNCVMCHGENLGGNGPAGPALVGDAFQARWRDLTPSQLYAFMTGQMPPNGPGSLGTDTYRDIAAYIFQANGFAPGAVAFTPSNAFGGAGQIPASLQVKHDAFYDEVMARRRAQLEHITPVTDQMLIHPSGADWLVWRGNYAGQGYSPLRQIDKQNAGRLTVAWSRSLPVSGNETTPIVHDGVLFIKSGNRVQAIDGASGDLLWQYVRPYPQWMQDGHAEIVKNLAIYQDKLYVPFLDGHLLALDVRSGKVIWDHVLVGPAEAALRLPGPRDSPSAQRFLMVADGGPMVARGEVIIGLAGCSNQYRGGCFIVGLNAQTGQEDWRFNTIARPGQPGGDSWNGAPVDQRFGGSVWFAGSYDPDLDLVYFGTGQTYQISTLLTPQAGKGASNDALYTDSTLALRPESGRLAWYYQHFKGDVWDLDWAFEQTLVTLPSHGRPTPMVVTGGKIGIFDALDRRDGHYQFSMTLGLQNIVQSIDPVTGAKQIDPSFMPKPGERGFPKAICPYARDEPSTAFDPDLNILYVPVLDASCPDPEGKFDGRYGRLEALNLATRKVAWVQRHRSPDVTSLLVTAGGLVFDGSLDRQFRASDAATGKVLWQIRLDNAAKSTPVTYTVNGKQYVAVIAGGYQQNTRNPAAEADIPSDAETLWVIGLPGASYGD